MTTATETRIDEAALNDVEKNALAILMNLPLADFNHLKSILRQGDPGVVGPDTLNAFVQMATRPPVNLDLSDNGVNQFKNRHGLGNSGALAGVIGPQTAGYFYNSILATLQAGTNTSGVRQINQAGLDLIKESEGYARQIPGTTNVTTYLDVAGVPTIGYGHTGSDVTAGLVITQGQAEALLRSDLTSAESAVDTAVKVRLNDNQFAALVSFTYNLGEGTLQQSTMLRLLNAGEYQDAAAQFGRFVYAGGAVQPGLVTRRNAEKALFLSG